MDNLKGRVIKLESRLVRRMVSWSLRDGSVVTTDPWNVLDCFICAMGNKEHFLLEKIRLAIPETYTGQDTFLQLIQQLIKSRERRLNAQETSRED